MIGRGAYDYLSRWRFQTGITMDLSSLNFNQVWALLQIRLRPLQKVRNWTALRIYLGDMMTVIEYFRREYATQFVDRDG